MDADGKKHTVSGGLFDISEYIPKDDVQPDVQEADPIAIPVIPLGNRENRITTLAGAEEWSKKYGVSKP